MTTTASTILQQFGGRRFIMMTGARNICSKPDGLTFKLPSRFAMNGINYISVTLNSWDLYNIEFGRVYNGNYKVLKTVDGIYNDQLQDIFTRYTGLQTKLF